jgi:hypothetical protein
MKLEEITLFSHLVARPESELDLLRAVLLIAGGAPPSSASLLRRCARRWRP